VTARLSRTYYLSRGHHAPATIAETHERSCTILETRKPRGGRCARGGPRVRLRPLHADDPTRSATGGHASSGSCVRDLHVCLLRCNSTSARPQPCPNNFDDSDVSANARQTWTVPHRRDPGQRVIALILRFILRFRRRRAWSDIPQVRGNRASQRRPPTRRVDPSCDSRTPNGDDLARFACADTPTVLSGAHPTP